MDVGDRGPLVLATVPTVPGRKLLYLGRMQQCGGRPELWDSWSLRSSHTVQWGGEHPTLGTWIQSALSPEPRTLSPLRNDVHLSCLVSPLHGFRKRRKWHAKSIWLLSFLFLDGENRLMYQASQLHHPASEMNSASFVSFFFLNLFWITLNQSLVHFPYRVFVFVLFWWGRTTQ